MALPGHPRRQAPASAAPGHPSKAAPASRQSDTSLRVKAITFICNNSLAELEFHVEVAAPREARRPRREVLKPGGPRFPPSPRPGHMGPVGTQPLPYNI
eukprot:15439837-Alexandrium_andersonii.AAC.1